MRPKKDPRCEILFVVWHNDKGFSDLFNVCASHTRKAPPLLSHQGNNICIHFNILCSFLMQKKLYCKWQPPPAYKCTRVFLELQEKRPFANKKAPLLKYFCGVYHSKMCERNMADSVSHKNNNGCFVEKQLCKKYAKGHGMCQNKPKKIMCSQKMECISF